MKIQREFGPETFPTFTAQKWFIVCNANQFVNQRSNTNGPQMTLPVCTFMCSLNLEFSVNALEQISHL
jgi:hypothetical protein